MTKNDLDKLVGRELSIDEYRLDKKIYKSKGKNIVYFYKREIQQDHWFYVPDRDKLYKINYDPKNYDPSVTETASKADSFQFDFDQMLVDGKIEHVIMFPNHGTEFKPVVTEGFNKEAMLVRLSIIRDELDKIVEVIKNI